MCSLTLVCVLYFGGVWITLLTGWYTDTHIQNKLFSFSPLARDFVVQIEIDREFYLLGGKVFLVSDQMFDKIQKSRMSQDCDDDSSTFTASALRPQIGSQVEQCSIIRTCALIRWLSYLSHDDKKNNNTTITLKKHKGYKRSTSKSNMWCVVFNSRKYILFKF